MDESTYTALRSQLLGLLGQASVFQIIDPLCADPVEMLMAAKETAQAMQATILAMLSTMPPRMAQPA